MRVSLLLVECNYNAGIVRYSGVYRTYLLTRLKITTFREVFEKYVKPYLVKTRKR